MTNISAIKSDEPDKDVVAFLEDLLSQANRGELLAIAVATIHKGGDWGEGSCNAGRDIAGIVMGLETCKYRIISGEVDEVE